jgi:alkylation response protein AidB-like acyl-CoA dehydrogenase
LVCQLRGGGPRKQRANVRMRDRKGLPQPSASAASGFGGSGAENEAARGLPDDALDAMHDAGLFRLLLAASLGGLEPRLSEYVQSIEAVARGDASVAWCMNKDSGCSMTAAYLAPEIAHSIWDDKRAVAAWGNGPSSSVRAVRAIGGWRVAGTYSFASGFRYATWLGAMAPCFEDDGSPLPLPNGKQWERSLLFPRDRAKIDPDVPRVMGVSGTGSDSVTVTDLFVDDAHAVTHESADERREAGSLYPFQAMRLYAGASAMCRWVPRVDCRLRRLRWQRARFRWQARIVWPTTTACSTRRGLGRRAEGCSGADDRGPQ